MAKNKKNSYCEEEINKRAKEHNCDEMCYTTKSIYPRAETCSGTRTKEFIATIIAIICYILFFNPIAWIIWLIILNYIISK